MKMKNSHRQASTALGLVLALAAFSCGKTPRTNFYTLQLGPPAARASAPTATQVGVERPRASHLLRQDRIVYFSGDNELNFYQYHRWAEPPDFQVQSLLIRQLRGAGLFDNVVPYRAQKGLDYVLRGRLLAMEEVDAPGGISARFGLELELVRQGDAQVVWSDRAARECPVAAKNVPAVVEALSNCAGQGLSQLTGSLGGAVARLQTEEGTGR